MANDSRAAGARPAPGVDVEAGLPPRIVALLRAWLKCPSHSDDHSLVVTATEAIVGRPDEPWWTSADAAELREAIRSPDAFGSALPGAAASGRGDEAWALAFVETLFHWANHRDRGARVGLADMTFGSLTVSLRRLLAALRVRSALRPGGQAAKRLFTDAEQRRLDSLNEPRTAASGDTGASHE